MSKDRLIAFTDAILAIIMTILVLELDKPDAPTLHAFWELRTSFFAYFLSFFWLGSLWIALNGIWEKVRIISMPVIWLTLLLLFLASFMPYATGLVSTYYTDKTIQGLYGLVVISITVCNWFLHYALEKPDPGNEELVTAVREYRKLLLPDIIIKVAGLILALLVYPPIMMYATLISAAFVMLQKHKVI